METKHTPGEWQAVERGNTFHTWVVKVGKSLVAKLTGADAEANARLIAAAPELLADLLRANAALHGAALELARAGKTELSEHYKNEANSMMFSIMKATEQDPERRAAIAKARA